MADRELGSLRPFVDRILRLKEEQDDLSQDIREVYREAYGNGFNKTIMGQLVGFLRKRAKNPDALEEANALLEIYLHAYEVSGTPLAIARACEEPPAEAESVPPHDPETGELTDEPEGITTVLLVGEPDLTLPSFLDRRRHMEAAE